MYCMKKIFNIFSLLAVLMLASCHGFKDPDELDYNVPQAPYTLSVDKKVIQSDGKDEAVLTITDVKGLVLTEGEFLRKTSFYIEELDEWRSGVGSSSEAHNVFTSIMDGTYTISAMYEGVYCENTVTITSENRTGYEVFHKNVAIYKLTGTWCQYCPYMTEALANVDDYTRDHSIVMAFHNNDDFAIEYNSGIDMASFLGKRFKFEGYPYAIYSLAEGSGKRTVNDIQRLVKTRLASEPARTGIKATSVVEDGKVTVNASVMASQAGRYDLGVAVLKDNCTAMNFNNVQEVYNDVVLMISGNFYAMSQDAFDLSSGEEYQVEKVCEHMEIAPGSSCKVVLFTLTESSGKVIIDNAVSFKVGESVDYMYASSGNGDQGQQPVTGYPQKMLGMQFTSIGCTNCPFLSTAIKDVRKNYPDKIIPVSFHMDFGDYEDPMALPVNTKFHEKVNTGDGLPMFAFNLRKSSSHIINEYAKIVSEMEHQADAYPAVAGVAVSNEYDEASARVEVKARFRVDVAGEYRYHIFLVEDGIRYSQLGSENADYTHDNVFRAMAADNVLGSKLNDGKPLVTGKEYTVTKTLNIDEVWVPENMRVVVAILNTDDGGETFHVNNANECAFGESVDYSGISASGGEKPVLTVDKSEIVAGSGTKARFSVKYGGADVTGSSLIICVSSPTGSQTPESVDKEFSSDVVGTYEFVAWYNGMTSDPVTLSVTSHPSEEGRFQRYVCVMEFTGAWCSQCPDGATTLNYLLSRTYKDKAFALAFHNNDDFALPQEQELFKMFGWSGYPAYVTDMRDVGLLNEGGCDTSIEKSLYETDTHCGVSVSSVLDAGSGKAAVSAKVFAERTMTYRIAAYVVEDKVIGEQKMGTGSVNANYTHRHVVRKMLSSNVRGESLGNVAADSEVEKSFEFVVEEGWNIDNLSVAVLAIDKDGHVNNMAVCAVNGGEMDYVYVNN